MTAAVAIEQPLGSLPLANARHERFCHEYLIDRNGSAAYRRAYPKATEAAARSSAADLLAKPNVAERVAHLEAQRLERIGMTADDVLRELQVLGTSDIRHYVFTDGTDGIALAENAPDHAMRAVQSVKRKTRRIEHQEGPAEIVEEVEYKLWSKPAALRMAGETHKMYTQKVEQTPVAQLPESGEAVMARVVDAMARVLMFTGREKRAEMLKLLKAKEVVVEPK